MIVQLLSRWLTGQGVHQPSVTSNLKTGILKALPDARRCGDRIGAGWFGVSILTGDIIIGQSTSLFTGDFKTGILTTAQPDA